MYDPLVAATARVEELEAKLNESMASVVKLTESTRTLERRQIVERATKDMVATDAEKFSKLVEDVEFESSESFTEKIGQMKDRYFAKDGPASKPTLTEASIASDSQPDETITSYVKALTKTAKR
jgi:Mn-dependent DtxR family transcriptional regulator